MTTKLPIPAHPKDEIFYPETDGMPLPDGLEQEPYFVDVLDTLKAFLESLDVLVSGNTIIYYVEGNPSLSVAPDCYVVFGIGRPALLEMHRTYRVWEAGKFPDFVLEIGSPSTADNDLGPKRELYARLGALEYWRYDPTGGEHYGELLVGEYLVDGEYRRFEMMADPDGLPRAHSPLLNLDLRWEENRLRFYDPTSGRWLENNSDPSPAPKPPKCAPRTPKREWPNWKPNSYACAEGSRQPAWGTGRLSSNQRGNHT